MTTKAKKDTDNNTPATKGNLAMLRSELQSEMLSLREFVKEQAEETRRYIAREAKETRRHFDVVAENIHVDVAGANQDEISLIKDQQLPQLEERVTVLERHAGIRSS